MENHKNLRMPIFAAILVVMLTSLACSFSAGNIPGNQPGAQPTFSFEQPTVQPTNPSVATIPAEAPEGQATLAPAATTEAIPQTGEQPAPNQPIQPPRNLEEVYTNSNPGVVSILVEVNQGGQSGQGAGSGFLLDDKGHIVTNHHVIEGASTIVVRFYNDADSQAQVVGDDPNSDLAILQVENVAQGAHPLPLGDSNKVAVGDSVVAIGNPFSLGTSMSYGIVSAIGRTIPSGFTPYNIPQAIQTDAAINPGNSGGPLINMNGEVIGINAQIRTGGQSEGNIGIGFAIPVNILKMIAPSLVQNGSYTWPYLGVGQSINPLSINAGNSEQQQGALIDQITAGGPADQGGLQEGDVVVKADGQPIHDFDDLLSYVAFKKPGDQVQLTVLRGNKEQQLTVTLGERPNDLLPQQ